MKTISRVISSAILLALTAALLTLAGTAPAFFFLWYPSFSNWILGILSDVTGQVAFPIWEALALGLAVWAVISLIRSIKKHKILRWLSGLLWTASIFVFLFTLFWGAGHFGPAKTQSIVTVDAHSAQELQEAALFYGQKAAETYGQGNLTDFSALASKAMDGYAALSADHSVFPDIHVTIKPLLGGKLYNYLGSTGIFVPITAEACVNPHCYPSSLPHSMCHEIAHRMGANAEEDANFCAFLACIRNPDPAYQYSGWYSAFVYCYNALYEEDADLALNVWETLTEPVKADIIAAGEHYVPYEGKAQETAQAVNDAYLKAFQQEGVKSYGLVSDALIAWYQQNFWQLSH